MTRTLLRPTAFVDAPFGRDGQAARLAGGMSYFSAVELIHVDGARRTGTELLPVGDIESRLDEKNRTAWQALTSPRSAIMMGSRTILLDQPQVMGILNVTPDSFSD